MKKSFYFALALTAGLFASCSSDDLTADAPQNQGIEVNDAEAAQISINIGSPNGATRGTGSVAGTEWAGQKFNLFMFKKWSFEPATYTPSENANPVAIYNDATLITATDPTDLTLAVQQDENGVRQFQYFPSTGEYAFWAYRIDDAWVDSDGKAGWETGSDITKKVVNGVATPAIYTWGNPQDAEVQGAEDKTAVDGWAPSASTEGVKDTWYKYLVGTETKYVQCTNATAAVAQADDYVKVPFIIDGTQDLMIAATDTAAAATRLNDADNKISEDTEAAKRIYSAYASRRGVNPRMQFSHLLSRLTFEVKAADRDVSTAATLKTNDQNEFAGFKVKKVEVWSKRNGDIIVAHKGTAAAPTERLVWENSQLWTDTTTLHKALVLKSREQQIEKADIVMVPVNAAIQDGATTLQIPNGYTTPTVDGDMIVFATADLSQTTGEPTADTLTLAEVRTANQNNAGTYGIVYYASAKTGDHGDANATKWDHAIIKEDPTKALIDLIPVIPGWKGYRAKVDGTPEWAVYNTQALPKQAVSYTWQAPAQAPASTDNLRQVTSVPGNTDAGAADEIVWYNDGGVIKYYQCTIVYDIDNAQEYNGSTDANTGVPTATNLPLGTVVKITDNTTVTYYIYHAAGGSAEVKGSAEPTAVGESLLVAPADENGYWVRFTFERSKKVTGTHVENITGDAIINVKVKNDGSFEAGKTYKVTAILYSDGEIKTEGATIINWADATGDLDDGGEGYGLE